MVTLQVLPILWVKQSTATVVATRSKEGRLEVEDVIKLLQRARKARPKVYEVRVCFSTSEELTDAEAKKVAKILWGSEVRRPLHLRHKAGATA